MTRMSSLMLLRINVDHLFRLLLAIALGLAFGLGGRDPRVPHARELVRPGAGG